MRFQHRRRDALLLDRSIASFLILGRKSDDPQFHGAAPLLERAIPPVTTVLLTVPFTQLAERRQEMSRRGHYRYQSLLFQQALRQRPADVIVIASTQTADDAKALIRIFDCNSHVPEYGSHFKEAAA